MADHCRRQGQRPMGVQVAGALTIRACGEGLHHRTFGDGRSGGASAYERRQRRGHPLKVCNAAVQIFQVAFRQCVHIVAAFRRPVDQPDELANCRGAKSQIQRPRYKSDAIDIGEPVKRQSSAHSVGLGEQSQALTGTYRVDIDSRLLRQRLHRDHWHPLSRPHTFQSAIGLATCWNPAGHSFSEKARAGFRTGAACAGSRPSPVDGFIGPPPGNH